MSLPASLHYEALIAASRAQVRGRQRLKHARAHEPAVQERKRRKEQTGVQM